MSEFNFLINLDTTIQIAIIIHKLQVYLEQHLVTLTTDQPRFDDHQTDQHLHEYPFMISMKTSYRLV